MKQMEICKNECTAGQVDSIANKWSIKDYLFDQFSQLDKRTTIDKNFQKVTNWSALVPEISSEQRNLWPFGLLDVVWMQWN